MSRRGIFFDLYGTLLVYGDMTAAWSAWLNALHGWMERQGARIASPDLAARCEGFFSRPEPTSRLDGLTLYEDRLREFCAVLDLRPGPADLRRGATTTVGAWQEFVALDPDAMPMLNRVAGLGALALVSNFDHPPHVEWILRKTGLDRHFEVVVVSGKVGVKKPDPRIFSSALDRLDLDPERVIYVGDAPEDIQVAQAAGMTPIRIRRRNDTDSSKAADFRHVATPRDWTAAGEHLNVSTLRELPDLLTELWS